MCSFRSKCQRTDQDVLCTAPVWTRHRRRQTWGRAAGDAMGYGVICGEDELYSAFLGFMGLRQVWRGCVPATVAR